MMVPPPYPLCQGLEAGEIATPVLDPSAEKEVLRWSTIFGISSVVYLYSLRSFLHVFG